jgi:hypothetical protein
VDVQVDERRGHGKAIVLPPLDGSRSRRIARRLTERGGRSPLAGPAVPDDNEDMRQVPTSLKLVAVFSLVAEATAAALVFWHTGPRAR